MIDIEFFWRRKCHMGVHEETKKLNVANLAAKGRICNDPINRT